MSASSTPDHSAVGADEQHVARRELLSAGHAHVGKRRVAAEAALDEVAHRMTAQLVLVDQPFAQKELDVAVVARALANRAARAAGRRGCRRRAPSRSRRPGRGTPRTSRAVCGRARRPCRASRRGRGRERARASGSPADRIPASAHLREAFLQRRDRDLGRARAVRVAAHAVDDDQRAGRRRCAITSTRSWFSGRLPARLNLRMLDAHELADRLRPLRPSTPSTLRRSRGWPDTRLL